MKLIFSYLVLLAFAMQIGSRVYVLVNFQLNKEYIAENLCEKRDEPESCCEGSCHLEKELNKVEESENQGPINSDTNKKEKTEDIVLYCSVFLKLADQTKSEILSDPFSHKTCSGFRSEISHPPTI